MTTNLTITPTFDAPVTVPANGDRRNAQSVSVPFQALANRTQYLKERHVATVAALAANAGAVDEVYAVAHYATEGDGGGGLFEWTADTTSVADTGTIIENSGTRTGCYKRIYNGPINVRWFGAVGDGNTNDWLAISSAILAAKNSTISKEVFFPPGQYLSQSPIGVPSGVMLIGASNASTFLLFDLAYMGSEDGIVFAETRTASGGGMKNLSVMPLSLENGRVHDCIVASCWDGLTLENLYVSNAGRYGINLHGCTRCKLDNVIADACYSAGLMIDDAAEETIVSQVGLGSGNDTLTIAAQPTEAAQLKITINDPGSQLSAGVLALTYVDNFGVLVEEENNCYSGNDVIYSGGSTAAVSEATITGLAGGGDNDQWIKIETVSRASSANTVSSSSFEGTTNGPGAFVSCAQATFNGCSFKNNGASSSPPGSGLYVAGGSVCATGCYFYDNAGHHIDLGEFNDTYATVVSPQFDAGSYALSNDGYTTIGDTYSHVKVGAHVKGGCLLGGNYGDDANRRSFYIDNGASCFCTFGINASTRDPAYGGENDTLSDYNGVLEYGLTRTEGKIINIDGRFDLPSIIQ